MIEILKNSNKIECKCGCVFKFEQSDVKHKKEDRIDGLIFRSYKTYKIRYVECPICSRELLI